jgi:hypothetical protein
MSKKYFTTTPRGEHVEVDQDTAKQLISMGKKRIADFEVEDVGDFEKNDPSLAEKTVSAMKGMITSPFTNPISRKLTEKGEEVKQGVQNIISNSLTRPRSAYLPEEIPAGAATLASAATEMAPFTPAEFAGAIATEVMPVAAFAGTRVKLAETIANKFLNTKKAILKKEIGTGSEKLASKLLKESELTGSRSNVLDKVSAIADDLEDEISGIIDFSSNVQGEKTIDRNKVVDGLYNLANKLQRSGVSGKESNQVLDVIDEFEKTIPEQIPVSRANEIKREIYRKTGDKGYLTEAPTIRVKAEKMLANSLKNGIEEVVPMVKGLNSRQGTMIQFRDSLINALAGNAKDIGKSLIGDVSERAFLAGARGITNDIRGAGAIGTKQLTDLINKKNK